MVNIGALAEFFIYLNFFNSGFWGFISPYFGKKHNSDKSPDFYIMFK
jgi:hypothetical protein